MIWSSYRVNAWPKLAKFHVNDSVGRNTEPLIDDNDVRSNDQNGTTKNTARYASAGSTMRYGAILLRCRLLLATPAIGCSAAGDGCVQRVVFLGLLVGERSP